MTDGGDTIQDMEAVRTRLIEDVPAVTAAAGGASAPGSAVPATTKPSEFAR